MRSSHEPPVGPVGRDAAISSAYDRAVRRRPDPRERSHSAPLLENKPVAVPGDPGNGTEQPPLALRIHTPRIPLAKSAELPAISETALRRVRAAAPLKRLRIRWAPRSPPRSRGGPVEARRVVSDPLRRVRAAAPLKRPGSGNRPRPSADSPPRSRGGPVEASARAGHDVAPSSPPRSRGGPVEALICRVACVRRHSPPRSRGGPVEAPVSGSRTRRSLSAAFARRPR